MERWLPPVLSRARRRAREWWWLRKRVASLEDRIERLEEVMLGGQRVACQDCGVRSAKTLVDLEANLDRRDGLVFHLHDLKWR